MVASRPLGAWRETLAILAAYSETDTWTRLCDALARRLLASGAAHAASLCWICAANVDSAVQQWSWALSKGAASVGALQVRTELPI